MGIYCYQDPISGQQVCRDEESGEEVTPPGETPLQSGAPGGVPFSPPNGVGEQMGPPVPDGYERPFIPAGNIQDIIRLPDGGAQVIYAPNNKITGEAPPSGYLSPSQYAALTAKPNTNEGVSASTAYAQQQQNARDAASRTEDQRQFQETFDFNKAKFNQEAQANAAQLAQQKELETQKLGLRPETIQRYLYALRGQQTPQQLLGGSSSPAAAAGAPRAGAPAAAASLNLPGEFNSAPAIQRPTNMTPIATPGTQVTAGVTPLQESRVSLGGPSTAGTLAGGTGALALQNPALANLLANVPTPAPTPYGPTVGPSPFKGGYTNQTVEQSNAASRALQAITPAGQTYTGGSASAPTFSGIVDEDLESRRMARGGIIPEHVVGMGMDSGQTYEFGEEGPEGVVGNTVIPNEMLERLLEVSGDVSFAKDSKGGQRMSFKLNKSPKKGAPKIDNSYAAGGAIGYSMDYNPKVFNPPDLSGIVGRGFNTPGVPLPPQVGMLTGGGQSLIPSAQSISNALPSELGAYSSFLTDEAGVPSDDVFSLAKRLAPQVSGVRTPSYSS